MDTGLPVLQSPWSLAHALSGLREGLFGTSPNAISAGLFHRLISVLQSFRIVRNMMTMLVF